MKNLLAWNRFTDNGGRRSGVDRRQYSFTEHIPERRSGIERRSGKDRRNSYDRTVIMHKIVSSLVAEERKNQ